MVKRFCQVAFAATCFIFSIIYLIGCGFGSSSGGTVENPAGPMTAKERPATDALSEADATILDVATQSQITISQVILPNGNSVVDFLANNDPDFLKEQGIVGSKSSSIRALTQLGPQDKKNVLIARMQFVADKLCNRNNFIYQEDGPNKPAQRGLGYSFGSKDYTVRQLPPTGGGIKAIYGLDCSGFIYRIAKEAGVDIPVGPADMQRRPETWNNAFSKSLDFQKNLSFQNISINGVSEIETGDIVYWLDGNIAFHIGIAIKSAGGVAVYASNGQPVSDMKAGDEYLNYGPTRGPTKIDLSNTYWFGEKYKFGVIRLTSSISGNWQLYFRGVGFNTDSGKFDVKIPVVVGGHFTANGEGIDYDGVTKIVVLLEGDYDIKENKISAIVTMTFPDGSSRKDSFETKLNRDDTDYIEAKKIVDNGGIVGMFRLVNLEK